MEPFQYEIEHSNKWDLSDAIRNLKNLKFIYNTSKWPNKFRKLKFQLSGPIGQGYTGYRPKI
jgi:hypothetical protein